MKSLLGSKNRTTIAAAVTLFLVLLLVVFAQNADAQISSTDDESTQVSQIYTDSILDKADIVLGENDKILRTDGKGSISLTIVRAFQVEIDYSGQRFAAECTEGTVAEAISKAGITLVGNEEVTPSLDTPLEAGMVIKIAPQCGVEVTVDGSKDTYTVASGTVGELLVELGIELGEDDIVTPSVQEFVSDGMSITVQRVEYRKETTIEVIDYGYVSEETSSMLTGTSKITQYGIEGEKTIVSKNKYVDGVLTDSTVVSEEVTREPVDQVKLIGTGVPRNNSSTSSSGGASISNEAGTFTDAQGNVVAYTKKLTGTSTAYYAAEGSTTATGVPVYVGGVAVNPNVIPYGSKLYIVSTDGSVVYGYATAVDTGGALMSGSVLVDVFFSTYGECVNWGRRNVTVYVIG